MSSIKSKSVNVSEQLTKKRDRENVRGLKIKNDLRSFYGYAPLVCLFILVIIALGLVALHLCGTITITAMVITIMVQAFGACAAVAGVVAKHLFLNE
jgi:hypothetical protein